MKNCIILLLAIALATPELKAQENALVCETLELAYENFTRTL